jgi:uncharacterized protein
VTKACLITDPFVPWAGIYSGHTQTLLGHLIPSIATPSTLKKEVIPLEDGDQMSVVLSLTDSPYVVLLSHGLGGNVKSDYMARTLRVAQKLNMSCVLINQRGADQSLAVKKSYHSGRGDDYGAVVKWIRQALPERKVIAIGFSMSGTILLNLLSGRCGSHLPDYGIAINAPLKLGPTAIKLATGFNKIYDLRFYRKLKPMVEERLQTKLPPVGQTLDIDAIYTAVINGFKDRDDYYEKCSPWPVLPQLKTKTFLLTSEDDPFVDVSDYRSARWSSLAEVSIQKSGGHMGYFSHSCHPEFGHRWQDLYIYEILKAIQTSKPHGD